MSRERRSERTNVVWVLGARGVPGHVTAVDIYDDDSGPEQVVVDDAAAGGLPRVEFSGVSAGRGSGVARLGTARAGADRAAGRNTLVRRSLERGSEWILFLDDDQIGVAREFLLAP